MNALWCERAWLGGASTESGVLIDIEAGRIRAVQPGVDRPDRGARRLPGLTLPGFANAHSHAFHRSLRGATQAGQGSFWTWRDQMYEVAAGLDPDGYHAMARSVFAEMAAAGFTAVGEFHYVHHQTDGTPYPDPNALGGAIAAAATDVGIRLTLLDTLYQYGGLGAGGYVPPTDAQRRFVDADPAAWIERVERLDLTGTARLGAALHSVRAVDPDQIREVVGWAKTAGVPLHAHVSEQPAENLQSEAALGATPAAVLEGAGAFEARFTAVHATHLTDDDIAALGATSVCCCPTTERDLADGIGPMSRLAAAGAAICIGSDSHAIIDPFEETRAVELNERLATLERGNHTVEALATMGTANGYRALGWDDGGRIEPGGLADLVTVDTDSVRLAGWTDATLLAAVVFAATSADVTHTVVDGRTVYERSAP